MTQQKRGRWQTESFAKEQTKHFAIGSHFDGTILDFGCGLGDAMPVYGKRFPKAKLIGIDISQSAMNKNSEKDGSLASLNDVA